MSRFSAVILSLCLVLSSAQLFADGPVQRPPFSVPDHYIVVLDSTQDHSPAAVAEEFAQRHGGKVGHIYQHAINGFTIRVPAVAAEAIARDPRVKFIEQNSQMFAASSQDTTIRPPGAEPGSDSLWGLDRIDQQFGLDNTFKYCDSGFGVKIYIVDSGVLKAHQEFYRSDTDQTTRVLNGKTFTTVNGAGITPTDRTPAPGDAEDYGTNPCNTMVNRAMYGQEFNHGTAVASAAAGRLTGTAKSASIVPVKVMTCGGQSYVSDTVRGLEWILQEHYADPNTLKVVNMSIFRWLPGMTPECPSLPNGPGVAISTGELNSLEQAVQALVANGITVVVSANNQNQDARNTTPARLGYGNTAIAGPHVITVGGSMWANNADARWVAPNPTFDICNNPNAGSNWGPAVDIFAPADDITVASIGYGYLLQAPWGYWTNAIGRSGTSFSAPKVAGIVARIMQSSGGATTTPAAVWQYLQNYSVYNALNPGTLNGSPNRLLHRVGNTICKVRSAG